MGGPGHLGPQCSALQVKAGDTQRTASSDFTTTTETFDLNLTDGQTHQVALYVQDESNQGRTETVTVSDATSGTVLATTNVSNFSNGEYLVYDLSGNVDITLTNGSGSLNALASGLFFDPGPGGSLSGTVFGDLNMDQAQEANEPAFAGQTLTVTDPNNNTVATATTDSAGGYAIGGLPLNEQLTVTATSPDGWVAAGGQVTFASAGPQQVSVPELRLLPSPSSLTASSPGDGEVDLSWTSNSAGMEQGFHIYESVDGAPFGTTPIDMAESGATGTSITGLSAVHDYAFQVTAFDANGDSAPSNVADAAAPGTPTGLLVESFIQGGQAYATLTWNASDPSPSGTTYEVFVSQTPNSFTGDPVASGVTTTSYTYGPYDPSLTLHF